MYRIGDVVSVNSDRREVSKTQKGHGDWVEEMVEVHTCMYMNCLYYARHDRYSVAVPPAQSCHSLSLSPHTVSGSTRQGGEGAAIRRCASGSEGQEMGFQSLLPPASTRRTTTTGGQ